jgi:hypothetical protein
MRAAQEEPSYQCGESGLVRAASMSLRDCLDHSPNLDDARAGSEWLRRVWRRPGFADAVRQASPGFADRVDHIASGGKADDKAIRRASASTLRYLLRSVGRHTPFGLFAGVTALSWGHTEVHWEGDHQPTARVDNQWLGDVIGRLENDPDVLGCLDVLFNNLARQRGQRLELPHGTSRVTIRYTSAVEMVQRASGTPLQFGALARMVGEKFPAADCSTVRDLLTELVRQGFLITCLRAPLTVIDPLSHLTARLHSLGTTHPVAVGSLLAELDTIRAEMAAHNGAGSHAERARVRGRLTARMRELSGAGRTPLAVDLCLDADIRLPETVARELEWAATALARLSTQPTGTPAWREFYTAFCDRYGTGTLVPVTDVLDPDSGLGFPPGYPGATLTAPGPSGSPERDEGLLALAWQAVVTGAEEIVLDEDTLRRVTVGEADTVGMAPHVELAARVYASSSTALQRGEFTLVVAPARSAGTLTSRFTPILTSQALPRLFRNVSVATAGALPVQMSCPPAYPHAQNIARVPAYLPHTLALGEHRDGRCVHDPEVIAINDLAVLATREGLHLVSMSRRCVVEPQVFHALALEKQLPPLARFLAHLPRALAAVWHEFDWGPHAHRLPYLPRVRYHRSVLAPARWNLSDNDLPPTQAATGGIENLRSGANGGAAPARSNCTTPTRLCG